MARANERTASQNSCRYYGQGRSHTSESGSAHSLRLGAWDFEADAQSERRVIEIAVRRPEPESA